MIAQRFITDFFKPKRKQLIQKSMCIATAKIDNDSALEHIQVNPLFRRQGIGKKLMSK